MLRRTGFATHLPELAAIALAAVIALTVLLALQYRSRVIAVEHTLNVETQLAEFTVALDNIELGERDYTLTGEQRALDAWLVGLRFLERRLHTVERLTSDNPEQARAVAALRPLVQERLERTRRAVERRRGGDVEGAVADMRDPREPELSEKIRSLVTAMKHEQKRVFANRVSAARETTGLLSLAAALGVIVTTAALSYWIWKARRDARELAASNHRLMAEMAEREAAEDKLRHMQKLDAVGQLTGGIAHDSNNMLAVITSALNLIQKRLAAGDPNIGRFVEAASEAAERGARLIHRLLAFARQQPLSPEPVDPNRLVAGVSELMARALGEDIKVTTDLSRDIWWTHADASQLENALLNIAVNARDAMPGGGKLTIRTANRRLDERYARENLGASPGEYVLIAVADTGSGMPPEVRSRAFEPFFTTKDVGKGSGLGLSQVFGFVKQTGGSVRLDSDLGRGTTVGIYLPRFRPPRRPKAVLKQPAPLRAPPRPSRQLILVVEDEARVRELTAASLRELGYPVIEADGATDALRCLDGHPETALLFTDIVMPGINGRKLACEAVRRHPRLKVLFTTGFARDGAGPNGATDPAPLLAKPFSLDELAVTVRDVLLT